MNQKLESELQAKVDHSVKVLQQAYAEHGEITFANSFGAEDVVITDLIRCFVPEIEIFSLDTGRLPEQTLELLARVLYRCSCRLNISRAAQRLLLCSQGRAAQARAGG